MSQRSLRLPIFCDEPHLEMLSVYFCISHGKLIAEEKTWTPKKPTRIVQYHHVFSAAEWWQPQRLSYISPSVITAGHEQILLGISCLLSSFFPLLVWHFCNREVVSHEKFQAVSRGVEQEDLELDEKRRKNLELKTIYWGLCFTLTTNTFTFSALLSGPFSGVNFTNCPLALNYR